MPQRRDPAGWPMAEDATPLVEALVTIIDAAKGLFAAGRDRLGRVRQSGARDDGQSEHHRRARRSWSPGGGVRELRRLFRLGLSSFAAARACRIGAARLGLVAWRALRGSGSSLGPHLT
jgi:hypothetical protein